MVNTWASRGGGGWNALLGSVQPVVTSKVRLHRARPGAVGEVHRRAMCLGTTTSARTRRLPRATRRVSRHSSAANGGLATTAKGRLGSRRSAASTCTTVTGCPTNRSRSLLARAAWSSTATTVAWARSSASVSEPEPAPTSTTRSPRSIPARATRRRAQRSSRRCHPHGGRPRAATENHHERAHRRDRTHGTAVRRPTPPARLCGQPSREAARRSSVPLMVCRFLSVRSSIPEISLLSSRADSGRRSSFHSVTRHPDVVGSMRYPQVE